MPTNNDNVLSIKDLHLYFRSNAGSFRLLMGLILSLAGMMQSLF